MIGSVSVNLLNAQSHRETHCFAFPFIDMIHINLEDSKTLLRIYQMINAVGERNLLKPLY